MITLTDDQAKQVLGALDEAMWKLGEWNPYHDCMVILRSAIGITEQDRAALVARTARGEHE